MRSDHERYADPGYRYAKGAGLSAGREQDPERCRWEVCDYSLRWPSYHQCSRKPSIDGLWCKQHSPGAVAARKAASEARSDASWEKRLVEIRGWLYRDALSDIAKGDLNDPVGYAVMRLEEIEK